MFPFKSVNSLSLLFDIFFTPIPLYLLHYRFSFIFCWYCSVRVIKPKELVFDVVTLVSCKQLCNAPEVAKANGKGNYIV